MMGDPSSGRRGERGNLAVYGRSRLLRGLEPLPASGRLRVSDRPECLLPPCASVVRTNLSRHECTHNRSLPIRRGASICSTGSAANRQWIVETGGVSAGQCIFPCRSALVVRPTGRRGRPDGAPVRGATASAYGRRRTGYGRWGRAAAPGGVLSRLVASRLRGPPTAGKVGGGVRVSRAGCHGPGAVGGGGRHRPRQRGVSTGGS